MPAALFSRSSVRNGVFRTTVAAIMVAVVSATMQAAPIVAGYERFGRSAADESGRVEAGLLLLGEFGCVNCHAATGSAAPHVAGKPGPVLDTVGRRLQADWLAAYLADPAGVHPGTTMPDLLAGLPADRRSRAVSALTHYLASTGPFVARNAAGAEKAKASAGADLYEQTGCAACHGSRKGNATPLADHRPLGDLAKKWSPAELDAFLKNPTAIRPAGRMPATTLSDDERRHIVAALVGPMASTKNRYETVIGFEGRIWRKKVASLPDTATLGPPAQSGPVTGLDIFALAGTRDGIVAELTGYFHAPQSGLYRFHLESDDGSRFTIDGTTVVEADGIHARKEVEGTVDLKAGIHPIRLAYFEAAGKESLTLAVTPPNLPRTNVLAYVTPAADGKPAATEEDVVTVPAFMVDSALAAEGQGVFRSMGCANCHRLDAKAPDSSPPAATAPPAKPLADLAALDAGCLADRPPPAAASYGLDASQRASLVTAIQWLRSPAAAVAPPREQAIDRSLTLSNCYACHQRDAKGGVLPAAGTTDEDGEPVLVDTARDALFAASVAELGDEGRRPPTLTGVGAKLRPEFLREVLVAGGRDRTDTMPTRMPKWTAAITYPLVTALAADPPVECAVPSLGGHEDGEIIDQGRYLVGGKALGCIKCHSFAGDKGQSLGLIDMTRMPERLRHEWFLAYVANPQLFRPGTRMPASWPDGKTFYPDILDGTAAGQIEAVWRYVSSSKPRPPLGAGKNTIELVPTKRPIIYRNFIENAGPRAIGVGFPEGVHLAWDAEALRLALVWRGAFIDAGRHWTGRGQGWQPPLGDGVFAPDAAAAIETLATANAPWPKEAPRARGGRFLGYALDAAGRPTFRWSMAGLTIEEKIDPVQNGESRSLRRTIRLAGRPAEGVTIFRGAVGSIENADEGWLRIDGAEKLRISGAGAGEAERHQVDGRTELRFPIVWNADGTAEIVEEIAW